MGIPPLQFKQHRPEQQVIWNASHASRRCNSADKSRDLALIFCPMKPITEFGVGERGDLPTSGVVFSSFGAASFLPFPTIFQRHRKVKFSIAIGKIQNSEKQVLLPLVFQ